MTGPTKYKPLIGERFWAIVRVTGRVHCYNTISKEPFKAIRVLPHCTIAVDDKGDEWEFTHEDFDFVKAP